MSMYPRELGTIPEETVRVARAACPKGTLAMRLRDALGELYQDEQFADLYPVEGQPAYSPWRLALVTVLQYGENLTDRQAANAVRERIDWKYALGRELTDAGFDFTLLSAFRTRLVEKDAENRLLERRLEVCKQRGWLRGGGKQRTDSTHVLARVRSLSNVECVGETLRAALNDLADLAPDWLLGQITSEWFERYSHRVENYRLRHLRRTSVKHWQSRLERMGCICCTLSNSQKRLSDSRRSKVCRCSSRSGTNIMTKPKVRPSGEQARWFPKVKTSSVLPTIQKPNQVRSETRCGSGDIRPSDGNLWGGDDGRRRDRGHPSACRSFAFNFWWSAAVTAALA